MVFPYIFLATALLLSACKRTPPPDPPLLASVTPSASAPPTSPSASPPEPPASASSSADTPDDPPPAEQEPRAAVSHKDFARAALYTWVSGEQAALLRRDRALIETLRKSKLPRLGSSLKAAKDPTSLQLLRVLKDNERTICGLAWSNPWGTAPPPGGKSEPRYLVKITLRPDAYVGFFDARQRRPWRFTDLAGREVAAGKVMARPERLGAIYYLIDGTTPLRGYALSSEEAVASWSLETDEIRKSMTDASAQLATWKPTGAPDASWPRRVAEEIWPENLTAPESTLASVDEGYQPEQWATLAGALKPAPAKGKPLVVKPSSARGAFADLSARGVHKQVCTEHGDKTRCTPLPPTGRRAYDGRFCVDEDGHMRDCKKR